MELRVISTGSKGNCYLLRAQGGSSLLLDAGVPVRRIVYALPDDEPMPCACLVTHEHKDHSAAMLDLTRLGIPVYASQGTQNAMGYNIHGLRVFNTAKASEGMRVGEFSIVPFETQHDAAEPLGYLIQYDPTGETLLYATDTYYLRNTFPGVHYWLIECNYTDEIMTRALHDGTLSLDLRSRLKQSHMSLKHLTEALQANDLREARAIVLCHLSDERSDEAWMVSQVFDATGVVTVAADDGMVIPLVLCPF